ncbi:MAG: PAS domain-containing sensor histidine kinase [Anaerolineae bacterium]|nr:PAS domain-containing sensor histidine kinase [Anaerolineae bacterium]
MSTRPPTQTDPQELQGILSRVNHLGTATERMFSRLYTSFNRRSRQQEEMEKTRALQRRNKQLVYVARKREDEIERLNGILATIDEGIILQDTEGRLALINQAARRLLGSQRNFWESELGTLFDTYRDITHLDTELSPLGEPTRVQVNNRILGAQVAAVAGKDGQRLGTMIVLRDMTRDTLSDRLKDQFITAISHELRTPMAVIKGMSEVVLGQPEGAPINRRFLETIGRNVDILDRMIVELLDISEMSADAFSIRQDRLNVQDLLWNVVNGLAPELVRAKLDVGIMVRDSHKLVITGDDQRLRWALGHLLQNSIRYTESGGHIVVTARREDAKSIAIQVVDTGVGISDKDLPHIFERFYRGEPRTRGGKLLDPRGLGQGLFIARKVAEAHHGYLTVRSNPGIGSVFTLILPGA